ncbi:MAG: Fic family protein [Myxococcaceae bacterium]|nr:Fic family protein [Myxococcaceae bacterium]
MKERYQELEEKTAKLRDFLQRFPAPAREFQQVFEMSWIYHDAALEGVVYTPQELQAALAPTGAPTEASLMPVVLEIRNQKAACDFIRQEAAAGGRKASQIPLTSIRRMHDLFCGNTPEAQAARAAIERREKSEKELARERDRSGFRKDMPLHRTYFHDIAQPSKIQGMLEKLVNYTASAEFRELHPIKQAATVQHMFLQVFPFTEHSGKVGRMMTNLVLLRHGYMPCIIHSIDRQRYYESFRGTASNFRTLLMEQMENSLDNALKYFQEHARRQRSAG